MSTVFRDRLKMLGDNADALAKWQAEAEQAEETTAHKQHELQSVATLAAEVVRLNGEIARVEAEAQRIIDLTVEMIGERVGEMIGKAYERIDETARRTRSEIHNDVARELAELRAKVDDALGNKPRTAKAFRFAGEAADDEVVDLPNPLSPRDLH